MQIRNTRAQVSNGEIELDGVDLLLTVCQEEDTDMIGAFSKAARRYNHARHRAEEEEKYTRGSFVV